MVCKLRMWLILGILEISICFFLGPGWLWFTPEGMYCIQMSTPVYAIVQTRNINAPSKSLPLLVFLFILVGLFNKEFKG